MPALGPRCRNSLPQGVRRRIGLLGIHSSRRNFLEALRRFAGSEIELKALRPQRDSRQNHEEDGSHAAIILPNPALISRLASFSGTIATNFDIMKRGHKTWAVSRRGAQRALQGGSAGAENPGQGSVFLARRRQIAGDAGSAPGRRRSHGPARGGATPPVVENIHLPAATNPGIVRLSDGQRFGQILAGAGRAVGGGHANRGAAAARGEDSWLAKTRPNQW